jgi:L-amino acid N-acyltransferase
LLWGNLEVAKSIEFQLVACTYEQHASAILDILNEAIINSTALYDYQPRPIESMVTWFATKTKGNFPVIGAIGENSQLLGFASYGTFRAWPAYKYSIEHCIYVHSDYRRQGIGLALMKQLIAAASEQQYHVMIGGIDMTNQNSIALHSQLGFTHAGTIQQAGFKFGRWLDLGFYQLVLGTPACPIDG